MREDAVCLAALALVFVVLVTNVINKNNIPLMVHYFTTHLSGKPGEKLCDYTVMERPQRKTLTTDMYTNAFKYRFKFKR